MELSWPVLFNTFGLIILTAVALGLFGIEILPRVRIALVMVVGVVILGFPGWALIKPAMAQGAITFVEGDISILDAALCIVLAYIAGLCAYFAGWPHGRYLAPLTVPTGIAYWALRSGNMTSLLKINFAVAERKDVYSALSIEGFFWLIVIAAGVLGAVTAGKLTSTKPIEQPEPAPAKKPKNNKVLCFATAILATVIIAQFSIGILAQDVRLFDSELGTVTGQPSTPQIAFAVITAFILAGFLVKWLLDAGPIPVTIAAAVLAFIVMRFYTNPEVIAYMAENYPVAFFARPTSAILPIQLLSFAAIGSLAGCWVGIKFVESRKAGQKK